MKGKNKCKILKQIRQKIADENEIPYVTQECGYQGECKGTCPRCEAELRYLERELEQRRRLGKAVAVAAVAAGLSLSLAACTSGGSGSGSSTEPTLPSPVAPVQSSCELPGGISEAPVIEGELAPMTKVPETEFYELEGDVAVFPDSPEDQGALDSPEDAAPNRR